MEISIPKQDEKLIAIVGPTGVGKSRLAIKLALQFAGEIVNGDSRQIYRYMDIGTDKPTKAQMEAVPHHLFNIVDPDNDYHLAQYQEDANLVIRAIQNRLRIPILAGGSGQYIMGLLEGWNIPRVAPNLVLRKSLEKRAEENIDELFAQLRMLDFQASQNIDKRNVRRVIRALEVCLQSGGQFSKMQTKNPPGYLPLIIGLTMPREELYRRTDTRVKEMFTRGLVNETEQLLQRGYTNNLPSMSSIGYKQAAQLLRKELNEKEALTRVQTETHRYIRHQYAWFKLKDPRIRWFDASQDNSSEIMGTVKEFLEGDLLPIRK